MAAHRTDERLVDAGPKPHNRDVWPRRVITRWCTCTTWEGNVSWPCPCSNTSTEWLEGYPPGFAESTASSREKTDR